MAAKFKIDMHDTSEEEEFVQLLVQVVTSEREEIFACLYVSKLVSLSPD